MIEKEIREVSNNGYNIIIYAPKGGNSQETYNENIGIEEVYPL